ncbi:MAG TPA: hypothetical protein PLU87_04190 [Sedimentisphaerales bacterium]|nr:hypothetical protein [Sedimentisphaerales bacterium]
MPVTLHLCTLRSRLLVYPFSVRVEGVCGQGDVDAVSQISEKKARKMGS